MVCRKCGTEFSEGIFCPECGTKYIEEVNKSEIIDQEIEKIKQKEDIKWEKEQLETERLEKEKAEQEQIRLETARLEKEKAEQEQIRLETARLEKEKAEQEKIQLEEKRKQQELEARTVRGTVYSTLEEAELAKKENYKVDRLKERLLLEKKQKKRQEILKEFTENIETVDARHRYELLKDRVDQEIPFSEKVNKIYGITVLISFIITFTWIMVSPEKASGFIIFCYLWTGFGIWIWIIWSIILFVKSKSKNYYKNIKNI